MFWPNVGCQYLDVFGWVAAQYGTGRRWLDRRASTIPTEGRLPSQFIHGGL
jgi:hypothetical protein